MALNIVLTSRQLTVPSTPPNSNPCFLQTAVRSPFWPWWATLHWDSDWSPYTVSSKSLLVRQALKKFTEIPSPAGSSWLLYELATSHCWTLSTLYMSSHSHPLLESSRSESPLNREYCVYPYWCRTRAAEFPMRMSRTTKRVLITPSSSHKTSSRLEFVHSALLSFLCYSLSLVPLELYWWALQTFFSSDTHTEDVNCILVSLMYWNSCWSSLHAVGHNNRDHNTSSPAWCPLDICCPVSNSPFVAFFLVGPSSLTQTPGLPDPHTLVTH